MPIIKSAKKRVKTAQKAAVQNAKTKRNFRMAIKQFQTAVENKKNVGEALSEAQSTIDTAVKKGVLHKNRAARKKQQLARQAKAAGITLNPSKRKTVKKKPAATKSKATKKTPAKTTATAKKTTKKAAPKKAKTPAKKKTTSTKK